MAVSKLFRTAFRLASGGFGLFATNTKDVIGSAFFDEAGTAPPVEAGTTVTYGITDTLDDICDATSLDSGLTDPVGTGGYSTLYPAPAGIRFIGVVIPQGSIITSATLTLKKDVPNSSGTNWGILKGVAADTAPAWQTTRPALAPKTTQFVTVVDGNTQSYNVTDIVQAIINRSGWYSGNALAFAGEGSSNTEGVMAWIDRSGSSTDCAQLSITYVSGTGPVTPTRRAARSSFWLY